MRVNVAPSGFFPAKCSQSPYRPGSFSAITTNGATMSSSQTGWVQTWSLDRAVIPKITSGITTNAQIRYPSGSGMCKPDFSAWAMIDPSSAKKMKVKLA